MAQPRRCTVSRFVGRRQNPSAARRQWHLAARGAEIEVPVISFGWSSGDMQLGRFRGAAIAALTLIPRLVVGQSAADSAAVRATAMDYIEGWYAGDAVRMERALHPEVVKRVVTTDPKNGRSQLESIGAMTLILRTRAGGGMHTPADRQQKDFQLLDMFANAAVARVVASDWVDYLELAKWNGRWVIVNVLWEYKPKTP